MVAKEEKFRPIRDGKFAYDYENGCYYDGDWLNNKRHGFGKFIWPSGASYDGHYNED